MPDAEPLGQQPIADVPKEADVTEAASTTEPVKEAERDVTTTAEPVAPIPEPPPDPPKSKSGRLPCTAGDLQSVKHAFQLFTSAVSDPKTKIGLAIALQVIEGGNAGHWKTNSKAAALWLFSKTPEAFFHTLRCLQVRGRAMEAVKIGLKAANFKLGHSFGNQVEKGDLCPWVHAATVVARF